MSANAGWFPDPSGRFGQRWYDGHRWSDQVVAADGSTIEDALPGRESPYPPPPLTTVVRPTPPKAAPAPARAAAPASPPSATAAPANPFAPPALRPPGQKVRLRPGATLGVGLLGLLLVVLSLAVLPWADSVRDVRFFDISEAARDSRGSDELLVRGYAAFVGFLLFLGAVLGVVLAGIPVPNTHGGATVWRIIASGGSGLAAILHTLTVVKLFPGEASPAPGAWLGAVGYFVIILAMVIGHYTRRRPKAGLAP